MTDQPTMSNGRALLLLLEKQKNVQGIKGLFDSEICNIAMSQIIATAPKKAGQHLLSVQRVDNLYHEVTDSVTVHIKYSTDEGRDRYGAVPFSVKGNKSFMPSMKPPNFTEGDIAVTKAMLAWLNEDCQHDGFTREIVNEQIIKKEVGQ